MRTFKIKKILVPETVLQVEMDPKAFKDYVRKLNAHPVLESEEALFFIPEDSSMLFFCKKEAQKK